MATTSAPPVKKAPFMQGSIIWERKGPLPVWAWALIALALLLVVVLWRKNLTSSKAEPAEQPIIGGVQGAPPVFNLYAPTTTAPTAPPGAGAPVPPGNGSGVQHVTLGPSLGIRETTGKERDLYDWLTDIGKPTYGIENINALRAMNPGLDSALNWRTVSYQSAKSPIFKQSTVVRVR